jgi:hypothetical protein
MAYNRELSQFASFVEVNDSSKRIGITTDLNVSGIVTASRFYGSGRFLTDVVSIPVPGGGNKQIQFNNSSVTDGASQFFYDSTSNNVGIGTSIPTSKLQVDGNVLVSGVSTFIGDGTAAGPAIFARRDSTNNAGIKLYGVNTGNWVYSESTSSNPKSLIFDSSQSANILFKIAGDTKVTIQPTGELLVGTGTSTGTASQRLQVDSGAYVSGSVGIGTTRPTSKLYVNGDAYVTGIITSTSSTVGGNVTINSSGLNVTGIITSTSSTVGGNVTINSSGLNVVGVVSATSSTVGGNVTINSSGLNVVGVVSATGFVGANVTINSSGINVVGVVSATNFVGDGSALTGISSGVSEAKIFFLSARR